MNLLALRDPASAGMLTGVRRLLTVLKGSNRTKPSPRGDIEQPASCVPFLLRNLLQVNQT